MLATWRVRKRIIPTQRPPLVGEVNAIAVSSLKFLGKEKSIRFVENTSEHIRLNFKTTSSLPISHDKRHMPTGSTKLRLTLNMTGDMTRTVRSVTPYNCPGNGR
jgi:hypothetical protein